jgi:hypothetical protein
MYTVIGAAGTLLSAPAATMYLISSQCCGCCPGFFFSTGLGLDGTVVAELMVAMSACLQAFCQQPDF